MKNKFFKLTPFKMQVLQSFPFIDADFDALTNYELLCKVVDYLNKTITNVNLLETDFKELYDYVHDYFDNLDVQEEINNKLDEMAESGQLQEIVSQIFEELDNKIDAQNDVIDAFKDVVNDEIDDQNDEIDDFKNSISTILDNMDNKIDVVSSGSPAGVYETVSALTTADPDHSKIYIVSENGNWYYYTNGSWTSGGVYQSSESSSQVATNTTNISNINNSILDYMSVEKYQFFGVWERGTFNYNTGEKISSNSSIRTSDYITVKNPITLVINKVANSVGDIIVFTYNSLGERESGTTVTGTRQFNLVPNKKYNITIYSTVDNPIDIDNVSNYMTLYYYNPLLYINVESFGADVDNSSADNTIAFQNAIDYAYTNKKRILVPDKNYNVGTLTFKYGTYMEGVWNKGQTWTTQTSLTGIHIDIPNDVMLCELKNISLQGSAEDADVIHIDDLESGHTGGDIVLTLEHCDIKGTSTTDCLYIGEGRKSVTARDTFFRLGNNGVVVKGSDATFDKCGFGQNAGNGIDIQAWVTSVIACSIYGNYRGVRIRGTGRNSVIIGCSIDRNTVDGIYNNGCIDAKVIGCTFRKNPYSHIASDPTSITSVIGCQVSREGDNSNAQVCFKGDGTFYLTDTSLNGGYDALSNGGSIYQASYDLIS